MQKTQGFLHSHTFMGFSHVWPGIFATITSCFPVIAYVNSHFKSLTAMVCLFQWFPFLKTGHLYQLACQQYSSKFSDNQEDQCFFCKWTYPASQIWVMISSPSNHPFTPRLTCIRTVKRQQSSHSILIYKFSGQWHERLNITKLVFYLFAANQPGLEEEYWSLIPCRRGIWQTPRVLSGLISVTWPFKGMFFVTNSLGTSDTALNFLN